MVPRINLAPPLILVVRPRFIWGWPIRSTGLALWRVGPTPHLKGFCHHCDMLNISQQGNSTFSFCNGSPKLQNWANLYSACISAPSDQLLLWCAPDPTGSTPLFHYPENLPGDAFPESCPCGHPCGVCLQPPSLDYPPHSAHAFLSVKPCKEP